MSSCTHEESDTLNKSSIVNIDKLLFNVGLTLKKLAVKPPITHDDYRPCTWQQNDQVAQTRQSNIWQQHPPLVDVREQHCVAIHDQADLSPKRKSWSICGSHWKMDVQRTSSKACLALVSSTLRQWNVFKSARIVLAWSIKRMCIK